MIELEKTYLAEKLPKNLAKYPHKEVIDLYIPASSKHPVLRIRKNGDKYEMTKKQPIKDGDASEQLEQTIILSKEEFLALRKIRGKEAIKIRYQYPYKGLTAEIDVFQKKLKGLAVVDFEFKNSREKNDFKIPDFCLVDVTQETFLAGGMLCGKTYKNISKELKKIGYKKLW